MSCRILFAFIAVVVFALATSSVAHADISLGSCAPNQKASVSTQHQIVLNGKTVSYTATVGFVEVLAADGLSQACIFYTSYVVASKDPRPLLFAFNGGPGSSSDWLHLGLLGPKRVDLGPDGLQPAKSLALIDNTSSPLDITDIVMIDPVATGFSHTEATATTDKFFGVKNDYVSIATFVRNFITINSRWNSPKFILGESYGGIRGPLLTKYLQEEMGIGIDGLVLVSPALSGASLNFGQAENTVPYWTYLPNFATTAWYHKRLSPALQALTVEQIYAKAKSFAWTRLHDALDAGSVLSMKTIERVATQMSALTGLDKDFLIDTGLRVDDGMFFSNILKSENKVIGRYDSRFVGHAAASGADFDPSDTLIDYNFTAGINDYLRVDLAWPLVSPYATSAEVGKWEGWEGNEGVLPQLASALTRNPNLKVLITSGYFDLACPMATVDYELTQMPGAPDIKARISHKLYFGGHASYINPKVLAQMKSDLADFISGH
jgi:carboxypeptidase C (cathepsin A)